MIVAAKAACESLGGTGPSEYSSGFVTVPGFYACQISPPLEENPQW
jgi:hypothetical protein